MGAETIEKVLGLSSVEPIEEQEPSAGDIEDEVKE